MSVTTHAGRTFDFRARHAESNRSYGIRGLVQAVPTKPIWHASGVTLNQGEEGACVPHAVIAEALASPLRCKPADPQALAFTGYDWCRRNDRYPGEDYAGTDVDAGMRWGREQGWWDSYRWAFGMADVKRALTVGPVVLGIDWDEAFYEPRRDGLLVPGGTIVGGHAILLTGWSPRFTRLSRAPEVYRLKNSWSDSWGINGSGYIRAEDLEHLLVERRGEAAVPIGRHLVCP